MSKLLLVDDEPKVLRSLRAALELDHEIYTCVSAAEAQILVRDLGPFDAIISDQIMPDTKGHELLNWCRLNSPQSKRIMLTGLPLSDELKQGLDNVEDVSIFSKPWNIGDIEKALPVAAAVNDDENSIQFSESFSDYREKEKVILLSPSVNELALFERLESIKSFDVLSYESTKEMIQTSEVHASVTHLVFSIIEATKDDLRYIPQLKKLYPNADVLVTAPAKIFREIGGGEGESVPYKILVKPYSLGRLFRHLAKDEE